MPLICPFNTLIMNPKLNKQLHSLLALQGLMEQKAELVNTATDGRTSSSSDMTDTEAQKLIDAIKPIGIITKTNMDEAKKTNTIRKCFSLFRLMGYYKGEKPDYDRINQFCLHRSAAKKRLTDMDVKELSNLIYQLNRIVKQ